MPDDDNGTLPSYPGRRRPASPPFSVAFEARHREVGPLRRSSLGATIFLAPGPAARRVGATVEPASNLAMSACGDVIVRGTRDGPPGCMFQVDRLERHRRPS